MSLLNDFSHLLPSPVVLYVGLGILFYLSIIKVHQLITKPPSQPILPLPPGPKRIPLFGNLFDLPTKEPWVGAAELAKEYGDVIHLDVLGQHFIYLNDYESASELLERRSSRYSDRVLSEKTKLMQVDDMLAMMPYGEKWKMGRRIIHQEFNSNTVVNFAEAQTQHCHSLLRHVFTHPEAFENHVKHFSVGAMLENVYGLQVQPKDDPYVQGAERAMSSMEALLAGAFLVDFLPFLKYVPTWLPGTSFKRKALLYRQYIVDNCVYPFREARKRMALGEVSRPNMVTRWMDRINALPTQDERKRLEDLLVLVSGAALAGGAETTAFTLLIFIYLMVAHPEVQAKIQAELDAVVGRSRLPDFSDKDSLPYVNAVCKEVIRWHPIVPMAVPHRALAEDEYNGMRIPEGALVIPNAWAMTRNKAVYGPDADLFRPERFLESKLRDPNRIVFGFGRRICPGRFLAENSVFSVVSSMMHMFKVERALDANGKEIIPEARWVSGLAVHLESYPCSIKPRFEGAGELLASLQDGEA